MAAATYIGDEVMAAAYRLAGFRTRVVGGGDPRAMIDEALESSDLVVIGASIAAALPSAFWHNRVRAARPLVAVLPDLGVTHAPDIAADVDVALGIVDE